MSQRVRRSKSPTLNRITSGSTTSGGGSGALTVDPGVTRLQPVKATVQFQLKAQSQPSLQTKSPHSAYSGDGNPPRSNKGGCEAACTRASTSRVSSPTRAASAAGSAVVSPALVHPASFSLLPSFGAATADAQKVTSSSQSSRYSPTPCVSTQGTDIAAVRLIQAQPPISVPSPLSVYTNSNISTSHSASPFSVSGVSRYSSPTQQLPSLFDNPALIITLQPRPPPSPASLSCSSSSSSSSRNRGRALHYPEQSRHSPGRRSLSSPVCKDKPRQFPSTLYCTCPSIRRVRRASSLDTLTGSYLSGHWPRDSGHTQCAPCMRDKATQTPKAWADECSEKRSSSHKRSASWGSTDQLKEIAKLRQQLQRSKHNSRRHRDKERKSAFNGNHVVISQSQAQVGKSFLIPVPKSTGSRFRNSMEGLNQEIERIIIRESGERDEQPLIPQDIPDGHRAPPPLTQRSSSTRSIDTQTPDTQTRGGGDGSGGGNHSNSSSRSQSISPAFLAVANDIGSQSPCPNEDLLTDGRSSTRKELEANSPVPKYAFSPKPNNSYMFKREPPEGCERVKAFEESMPRLPRDIPQFLCPDRNKVNFIPKSGSAFCLVSILKPLLPTQELTFKSSGALGIRSLSPSLSSPMALEQEQRVSRGTCTSAPQPCLPFHPEEPES